MNLENAVVIELKMTPGEVKAIQSLYAILEQIRRDHPEVQSMHLYQVSWSDGPDIITYHFTFIPEETAVSTIQQVNKSIDFQTKHTRTVELDAEGWVKYYQDLIRSYKAQIEALKGEIEARRGFEFALSKKLELADESKMTAIGVVGVVAFVLGVMLGYAFR